MKFDEEQKRAIYHLDGPLLLIAGPGSGKTTTMIERLYVMITKHNIRPERILVITFSKAAALEMKKRFNNRMKPISLDVRFGTFHSVFLSMIKSYFGDKLKLRVVSESVKKKYVEALLREIGYEYILYDFIDEFLLDVSLYKNSGTDISSFSPASCDFDMFVSIYSAYEEKLKNNGYVDFDDIITLMNELLTHNLAFREHWQGSYDYILIDEFQDINAQQFSVVQKLSEKHNNLFAVGDEDQSIYGFRGSKPEIMMDFKKVFKDAQILYLCGNYRSGKEIVNAASNLISKNKKRYDKQFIANNREESCINIYKFRRLNDQLDAVFTEINRCKCKSMAVLCRTNADKYNCIKHLRIMPENVKILTMHECKGLEFDFVWIINASEGICPFKHPLYASDMEEERRLFYVAVTRAKSKLNISYCIDRKGLKRKKSRFIKELNL